MALYKQRSNSSLCRGNQLLFAMPIGEVHIHYLERESSSE